ncbi:MAG TPA: hypothetical protein VK821_05950 [Dehalococcoidia bacterium]|nr:hypothetical protein [Dehalococcoidia bacterium]
MSQQVCCGQHLLTRRRLLAGLSAIAAVTYLTRSGRATAMYPDTDRTIPVPTLLVYNTAQGLLSGDLDHAISPTMVQDDVDTFPAKWVTLGVGTTDQRGRTGE